MHRIAALFTLIVFAGCTSDLSVAVIHTVPPKFNIVPAKRLAIIGDLGKPDAPQQEDEFIDVVIRKLQEHYPQYEVKDERAFARSLDPFSEADWHKYLDQTAGDVIVKIGVGSESCTSWERTRDDDTDDADDVVGWGAECRARLDLYTPRTGERIGFVNADEQANESDESTAWNEAMSDAADEIIGGFAPQGVAEGINLDRNAPLLREGMAKFDNRDYDGALELWEGALTKDPNSAPLLFNLGALCDALDDQKAALAYYSRAIAIAPSSASSLSGSSSPSGKSHRCTLASVPSRLS